jgi:hypothetical protein
MTDIAKHYSYFDLLLWLQKVVAEKGEDYVYPTPTFYDEQTDLMEEHDGECLYFAQELNAKGQLQITPSCIVGHVLDAADIYHPTTDVPFWNGMGVTEDFFGQVGFTTDNAGAMLLHEVQRNQDNGVTWGDSLLLAQQDVETRYPEVKA